VQMLALRGQDLSSLVPPDAVQLAEQQVSAYWSATWYGSLLSFVERALALPVQISLSILVLQVFVRRQSRWLWMAIGWHTLVDALAVFSAQTWGIYLTEGLIALVAAVSVAIIFVLREPEAQPVSSERPLPTEQSIPPLRLPELEETLENLESTRYN
ncbi:MAG TPA: YhfC family glutamic-type intramembrane protease, partial [Anaerolineales bacterium]|nr:YhfC family glutamic-type intramembrane protease [Anaerolineales bacterium]